MNIKYVSFCSTLAAWSALACLGGCGDGDTKASSSKADADGGSLDGQITVDIAVLAGIDATDQAKTDRLQACQTYYAAWCERMRSCDSQQDVVAKTQFANDAACVAAFTPWCAYQDLLPGVTWTADERMACGQALATADCKSFSLWETTISACSLPAGTRATGATCVSAMQCQSLGCSSKGSCLPITKAGEACATVSGSAGECAGLQVCWSGKCVAVVGAGQACGVGVATCQSPYRCEPCSGTCALVPTTGQGCGAPWDCGALDLCDSASATCSGAKPTGICQSAGTVVAAGIGQPCGALGNGSTGACQEGSAYCSSELSYIDGPLAVTGTCNARGGVGSACTAGYNTAQVKANPQIAPAYVTTCGMGMTCQNGSCAWP